VVVPLLGNVSKRILVGRKLARDRLQQTRLPKRVALPVYSSDPLSSVAYATQEILVVLTLGGLSYLYLAPWAATAVVITLVVIVASYRHLAQAYPNGGREYQAATTNLGHRAGLVAGAAVLLEHVLAVAVAVSAATDNLVSALPATHDARLVTAVVLIGVLALGKLRGVSQSAPLFVVPVYLFILAVVATVLWGLIRTVLGDTPVAESAEWDIRPEYTDLSTVALVLLVVRAFAGGSALLTGVGTLAGAVPAFRTPRRRNAATTIAVMGTLAVVLFAGITALALIADVRYVRDPCDLVGFPCETEPQRSVVAQVAAAVFGDATPLFFVVAGSTVLVLLLAAITVLNGFPMFASVLAQHRKLPRQLRQRGDRLAFGNSIVVVTVAAMLITVVFDAAVSDLIRLYLATAFLAYTLGQVAMIRHWSRQLAGPLRDDDRGTAVRARLLSVVGAVLTGGVAVVVTVAEFLDGVWIVIVAVVALAMLMRGIRAHYDRVERELAVDDRAAGLLPSRIHAIVLVSRLHKPTMRALAYARSGRPDLLEAIAVNVDLDESRALTDEWDRSEIPVPLKVLDSPYEELSQPVLEYVKSIRRESPRDLVVVYIPEYVLGRWWERLLHNKSTGRLREQLTLTPGVMVTSVPWQLDSSELRGDRH
jgi:amino acid transporter